MKQGEHPDAGVIIPHEDETGGETKDDDNEVVEEKKVETSEKVQGGRDRETAASPFSERGVCQVDHSPTRKLIWWSRAFVSLESCTVTKNRIDTCV